MAKTPVTMQVKDYQDREVLMVTYDFEQATDREGQMTGIARGGKIKVRVKALNDGNPDLLAWMIERNLPKDVTIIFNETKTGKEMKRIEATGAYCVDYHENCTDQQQHYEEIVMTCQNIKFGQVEFQNEWR